MPTTSLGGVTRDGQRTPYVSDPQLIACRAAWFGARIILRQVSPESPAIFGFILELHRACDGDWDALAESRDVDRADLDRFLTYSATFLSNIGNYFVRDQLFPQLDAGPWLTHLGRLRVPVTKSLCPPSVMTFSVDLQLGSRRLKNSTPRSPATSTPRPRSASATSLRPPRRPTTWAASPRTRLLWLRGSLSKTPSSQKTPASGNPETGPTLKCCSPQPNPLARLLSFLFHPERGPYDSSRATTPPSSKKSAPSSPKRSSM